MEQDAAMKTRDLLDRFVEYYDMIQVGGPDEGQTDRDFVMEMQGHRREAERVLGR